MVALLGELRRERNGAVADAMCLCGKPYGLNYGVSLPTLRRIARAETPDHDLRKATHEELDGIADRLRKEGLLVSVSY